MTTTNPATFIGAPWSFDITLTYYLAGPMSGIDDYNFPAFEEAERQLIEVAVKVHSPHRTDHGGAPGTVPYNIMIDNDLRDLAKCQGMILLEGWAGSHGVVQHELPVAQSLQMPVYLLTKSYGSLKLSFMGGGSR